MTRWMGIRIKLTETDLVRAWNFYHPEDVRPVPPRVSREEVPRYIDALDILLVVYILQSMLDEGH